MRIKYIHKKIVYKNIYRDETRRLIVGGGGGVYSYIHVLPGGFKEIRRA